MIARLAILASALALSGCAGIVASDPSEWNARPSHTPLRPYMVEMEAAKLASACNEPRQMLGCAVRLQADNVCIIYTAPKPAAWVVEHEKRHCLGWDHA